MTAVLTRPEGRLRVEELGPDRRRISLEVEPGTPHGLDRWETEYPVELIEAVFAVKGLWACDEIRRDEDPAYVEQDLRYSLLGYVEPEAFAGKRLLDLGCGCGSSSLSMARMLPETEIVGAELIQEFVELARRRAAFHGMQEIAFHLSPHGQSLPEGVGDFDFVVLSAVHEHLLPVERRALLPMIWGRLRPGGVLFVNQLPHRYSPVESHTTHLPLVNYLPRWAAHRIAVRRSRWVRRDESWEDLLRRGIRGGTASEIVGILDAASSGKPVLLEPSQLGMRDRIDLWFALSSASRWPALKRFVRRALKALRAFTGVTFVPELSLAIRKGSTGRFVPAAAAAPGARRRARV